MDIAQIKLFIRLIILLILIIFMIINISIFIFIDTTVVGALNASVPIAAFILMITKFKR